jgi:hypothetical protein
LQFVEISFIIYFVADLKGKKMTTQITIRSDRDSDYKFTYKGEEVVLGAGKIISIADGLEHVVLPTTAMKIMNNLIVVKDDVKK